MEYNIGNGMQQSEVVTDTHFSRSQLTTGDPFTVRVIAEGQPGYSETSPRFTVVPQSEGKYVWDSDTRAWSCCMFISRLNGSLIPAWNM